MGTLVRCLTAPLIGAAVIALESAAPASGGAGQERSIVVDRWLVSATLPPDSLTDPLADDLLGGPGEAGVLPDRGQREAGVVWHLTRRDSATAFYADGVLPERPRNAVVYAHAYIRLPEDRTLVLAWSAIGCGRADAWLNGRRISALSLPAIIDPQATRIEWRAPVRLGQGWNTLLLKLPGGECPLGWSAELQGAPAQLARIRVQASRPPGDVRTGPRPWVLFPPEADISPRYRWEGNELWGTTVVRLSGWAPVPFDSVELRMRIGGVRVRAATHWLEPGTEDSVLVSVPVARLLRALGEPPPVRLEARWEKEKIRADLGLSPEDLLEALHAPIQLVPWSTEGSEGSTALPREAGERRTGEWTIPALLDGLDLGLDVRGAPGTYLVNGQPGESGNGRLTLCERCRKGRRLRIAVTTTGPWTRFPPVRLLVPGYPAARDRPDAPPPGDWIRVLDRKGGRGYREMGERWGTPDRSVAPACEPPQLTGILPPALQEASGIVRDPRDAELFWLHNDSGNRAELFAVRADGRIASRHPLAGVSFLDPEDLSVARCGEAWCLYLADIGDNQAIRPYVEVHRLPLPPLPSGTGGEGDTIRAEATWRIRYPDGPRDAESLVVDPERGEVVILSKGREALVSVYAARLAELEREGVTRPITLRRVGRLAVPIGTSTAQLITAADLSPDGTRLAVRSYATLFLMPWEGAAALDTLHPPPGISLLSAREPQGEGVAFEGDGLGVFLASEGRDSRPPQLTRLRCRGW